MHAEQSGNSPAKIPLVLLVNALIGFFFGLCLMPVFSVLVWSEFFSEGLTDVLPIVSATLACILSAWFSGKTLGRGLLFGIVQGFLHYLISYLMGLLSFLRLVPSGWNFKLLLFCLLGGILGGILSAARIKKF